MVLLAAGKTHHSIIINVSGGRIMVMYAIAGVLFVLWLLGLIYSIGGIYVHLLLVVAIVLTLTRAIHSLNASNPDNIP